MTTRFVVEGSIPLIGKYNKTTAGVIVMILEF